MRTKYIPIYHVYKSDVLQMSDGSPVRSFITPWLRGNLGLFRVNLTIIGPKTEQPERYFPLSRRQAQDTLKTITDKIKLLEKELR